MLLDNPINLFAVGDFYNQNYHDFTIWAQLEDDAIIVETKSENILIINYSGRVFKRVAFRAHFPELRQKILTSVRIEFRQFFGCCFRKLNYKPFLISAMILPVISVVLAGYLVNFSWPA